VSLQENLTLKSHAAVSAATGFLYNRQRMESLRSVAGRTWPIVRNRPYLFGGLLLALIAAGAYLSLAGDAGDGNSYETAVVARGDIEDAVTALGNLQPKNYVDVGAQATGQLKKLYVRIGDTVKQGQLLAEIDPQVANARVQQDQGNLSNLEAQLSDKQAQAALAQLQAARQARLRTAGATSTDAYDTAQAAARSAIAQVSALKAQIAAAQAQLNGDRVTLGYTKIYAPMAGTVASISILQGQTINSVQQAPTILRIADLSTMEVLTQVSEADVPKLKIGMPAYFTTLGQPDRRWYGTLEQIQPTPTVTNNVVLYTATFSVANPSHKLMTQMTAQVFFVTASAHNVVTVPVSALHQGHVRAGSRSGSWTPNHRAGSAVQSRVHGGQGHHAWVLVLKPDGSVERRRITTGVRSRVAVEVVSGLQPGERVVVGTAASSDTGAQRGRSDGRRFRSPTI